MDEKIPVKMGPYILEARIGHGGMGTVYSGFHEDTKTPVAVKVLSEKLSADASFRMRFEKEIEALRQLRHPGIIRMFGYGQEERAFFYSMELVEGNSLEEEIASGRRFSWKETLALGIQVCSALRCAHDHGIIHRDLKPGNLLLSPDGKVKLSDFGIATLFGSSKLTGEGNVIGTIEYMAPEQATLQPITVRTDLYSLGAVLVALMSGHPPFMGKNLLEMVHQHQQNKAKRPSQLGIKIPLEFDALIGKLLERDPEKRPRSAYVLLRQMESIIEESSTDSLKTYPVSLPSEEKTGEFPGNVGWYQTLEEKEGESEQVDSEMETGEMAIGSEKKAVLPKVAPSELPEKEVDEIPAERKFFAVEASSPMEKRSSFWGFWETPWGSLLLILVGTLCLGWMISCGISYWTTPPSADVLYQRIMETAEQEDFSDSYRFAKDVRLFLNYYTRDPRTQKIQELQTELELDRLEKRLRMHTRGSQALRTTHPIERDYQKAIHELSADPGKTLRRLEVFVTFYEAIVQYPAKNPEDIRDVALMKQYLEIAKRQIFRIRQILARETGVREKLWEIANQELEILKSAGGEEEAEKAQTLQKALDAMRQERDVWHFL
ncbi:MAG: serine/threonine-protein kinase [Planctomycetia bacterium]|nr:serine/threonine-protein kinase [Planctomycetia bacterium]